jgi:hypothetical protein
MVAHMGKLCYLHKINHIVTINDTSEIVQGLKVSCFEFVKVSDSGSVQSFINEASS